MKILFHANTLNFRGTTVALNDYARYNEEILGNESIIIFNDSLGYEKDVGSSQEVVHLLASRFKVLRYKNASQLQAIVDKGNFDLAYFIRAGNKEALPGNVKTGVHAVFQYNEPHGDVYAYVSEWLSKKMSDSQLPFVPHIVQLPSPTKNYRKALGIRDDQIVIGRIGGHYTFDLPFVQEAIKKLVEKDDRFVFLMMGTYPSISHTNIKYIRESFDTYKKANFINTCDAMLHARERGESFGLAIAEFLSLNKPVLSWENGHDLNHLEMLKDSGTLYNESNLLEKLLNIKDLDNQDWTKRVEQYKPIPVMEKFKKVFLC